MLGNPDFSAIFAPKGLLLREGDLIRRTNYSNTLSTIASHGPSVFYKGPIADALVSKIQASGGVLTHADLEGYKVSVDRALEGTYFGSKVYTTHAPASGPVLLQMFNLMEHFTMLRESGRTGVNVHRLVEAMKCESRIWNRGIMLTSCITQSHSPLGKGSSFSDSPQNSWHGRTKICDPSFSSNMTIINNIPTKEYANSIVPNITDDRTHPPEYYNPEYSVHTDHGTSHSSIVDKDSMAVAITSSINLVFGSAVLDPVTGVIFDDTVSRLDIFSCFRFLPSERWTISLIRGFPMPGECTRHLVRIF
jgi:gamma-glutamyltranspeptidase/glutathione hydrolase/leukotriene-C4 hydrolase